jgi:hypothetical protein
VLRQLSDVPDGVQALEAARSVTSDDYAQVLAPLVERVRRAGQRLRLLYQFGPSFARHDTRRIVGGQQVGHELSAAAGRLRAHQ